MRLVFACACLLFALVPGRAASLSPDDVCWELRQTLPGSIFRTTEPLYDTEIAPDGIVKLERDDEEIDPQRPAEVVRVRCRRNRMTVQLRRFDWSGNPDFESKVVDIYFEIDRHTRRQPEAFDTFEIMLGYVFEPIDGTSG